MYLCGSDGRVFVYRAEGHANETTAKYNNIDNELANHTVHHPSPEMLREGVLIISK